MNAISVKNISKKYELGLIGSSSIRDTIASKFSRERKTSESGIFWALKDINFEVPVGQTLGIIGHNGAGKSTLLKVISKITEPTTGSIIFKGRVASLLEVGTGFHPELTGRENIFLNGAILGMGKAEIKRKFDEIVDFSGVKNFLETPVKRYSSGMYVRLAFSVAAHLEPEILLVDEVLSVGDYEFQKKCLGKMGEVSRGGRTVLFISHNMGAVSNLCERVILINKGKVIDDGSPEKVIYNYLTLNDLEEKTFAPSNSPFQLEKIEIYDEQQRRVDNLTCGGFFEFKLIYKSKIDIDALMFKIEFFDIWGNVLFTCNNHHQNEYFKNLKRKDGAVSLIFDKLPLNEGSYVIKISSFVNNKYFNSGDSVKLNVQKGDYFGTGKLPGSKQGILVDHSWSI